MSRRLDTEVASYLAQARAAADWLGTGMAADPDAPTVLPGWSLRTLVGHLVGSKDGLATHLARPAAGPATPVGQYVRAYGPAADEITAAARRRR